MVANREIWLKAAHAEFAKHGEKALNIESLSSKVGKSRSSFYHLFGDLESFREYLLDYALRITGEFADEADAAEQFFPDYIDIVLKYKDMIFFNKQIFIQKQINEKYQSVWEKISARVEYKTSQLWMKMLDMENLPEKEKEKFYKTIRSAAYMRLDYDQFNYENIFRNISDINRSFGFLLKGTVT